MRFTDELTVHVEAGAGGDGAVHFARLKYQPFAGPDGGDGGRGGSVVMVASRNVEDLKHLQKLKLTADAGGKGLGNLMIGSDARDMEVQVPPGTIALGARTRIEAGAVMNSGESLVLARGGKGGKGNVHLASGKRRTPKVALPGQPGEALDLLLRYRIACEVALLEPAGGEQGSLLPLLLNADPSEIDYELYRRKPRWIRIEHEYRRYDIAYLPFDFFSEQGLFFHAQAHVYWAKRLLINLLPLGEHQAEGWEALREVLLLQDYRRLERFSICSTERVQTSPFAINIAPGEDAGAESRLCRGADEALGVLQSELTGGVVA